QLGLNTSLDEVFSDDVARDEA
ncbi:helix-turn-helix transcriptional regulator, partial [Klebsiella pneumoniae]